MELVCLTGFCLLGITLILYPFIRVYIAQGDK